MGAGVLKNAANKPSGVGDDVGAAAVGVGANVGDAARAGGVCEANRFPVAVGEESSALSRCSFSHWIS